jgi:aminotransferase EvaB
VLTDDVPQATPTRLAPEERSAVDEAIAGVLRDGPWIGGPVVSAFESAFAGYIGGGHVVGCANGTDALVLAMTGLELPLGAAVLVASNDGGFAATAVRLAGLVPLPVDLDPITLAPTPATAAAAASQRFDVVAIVVAHLHGDPLDLAALDAWRRERGLRLIEDCAQAHGARRDGRHVGLVGDAATYSFYPTKNLGAAGDAGAVVFADPDVASHARKLAQYGWDESHSVAVARGRNSRLDPIQAAILQARLPFLDSRNARRRQILNRYRMVVQGSTVLGDPELGTAHHAVIRSEDRDGLARHLLARGIRTAVHYPVVIGDMPGLQLQDAHTPVARTLAGHILSLPCTPELTDDEILRVESALAEWESA